ncbi:MAG: hypothetical protein QXX12_05950 [Nanopusillaceae archaeon]
MVHLNRVSNPLTYRLLENCIDNLSSERGHRVNPFRADLHHDIALCVHILRETIIENEPIYGVDPRNLRKEIINVLMTDEKFRKLIEIHKPNLENIGYGLSGSDIIFDGKIMVIIDVWVDYDKRLMVTLEPTTLC